MQSLYSLCLLAVAQSSPLEMLEQLPGSVQDALQPLLMPSSTLGRCILKGITQWSDPLPAADWQIKALCSCEHLTRLEVPNQPLMTDKLFVQLPPSLAHLNVAKADNLTNVAMESIATSLPALKTLILDGCSALREPVLLNIFMLDQLQLLSVKKMRISDQGIAAALQGARCTALQSLAISNTTKLTRVGVDCLVWPTAPFQLVELELSHLFKLQSLPYMAPLRALDISGCPQLSLSRDQEQALSTLSTLKGDFVDSLRSLEAFPSCLERLEIGYCKNLPLDAFNHVMEGNRYAHLTHLRLQRASGPIEDHLIVSLSSACGANLQELQLYPCMLHSEGMHAIGRGMPRLQVLHLAGVWNSASDEALLSVAHGCLLLKSLSLAKLGNNGDQVFLNFAKLPALKMLDINMHTLSAEGLIQAAPYLQSLKALSLRYCSKISGDSLVALALAAKRLATLDISHTQLQFADVRATLERCPSLDFLNCTGFHLQPEEKTCLAKQFPNVTIYET